eukprot:16879-Heterococcus_DN1.PRE.1
MPLWHVHSTATVMKYKSYCSYTIDYTSRSSAYQLQGLLVTRLTASSANTCQLTVFRLQERLSLTSSQYYIHTATGDAAAAVLLYDLMKDDLLCVCCACNCSPVWRERAVLLLGQDVKCQ